MNIPSGICAPPLPDRPPPLPRSLNASFITVPMSTLTSLVLADISILSPMIPNTRVVDTPSSCSSRSAACGNASLSLTTPRFDTSTFPIVSLSIIPFPRTSNVFPDMSGDSILLSLSLSIYGFM